MPVAKEKFIPRTASRKAEARMLQIEALLKLLEPALLLLARIMRRQERLLAAKMVRELGGAKTVNKGPDGSSEMRADRLVALRDTVLHLRSEYSQLAQKEARLKRAHTEWHRSTCTIVHMVPGHGVLSAPCGRPCRCTCIDDKHACAYCYACRNSSRAFLDRHNSGRNPYKNK
jgi:hypothetical protein